MIIYYSSPCSINNIYQDLQKQRTANENPANFLACPAVRDLWKNVYAFSPTASSIVTFALEGVSRSAGLSVSLDRKPQLEKTNIFNLNTPSYFFCEEPVKMKVTAPYFHRTTYQQHATFVGGIFDIGRWFRPLQTEILTWTEKGSVEFKKNEPLFYAEFLTDKKITLQRFVMNPIIHALAIGLINSPFQNEGIPQGGLESRYEAFENSDYRKGLIEEIKAALVSDES